MDYFFKPIPKPKKEIKEVVKLPIGRVSTPTINQSLIEIKGAVDFIKPGFEYEYIPVIRKLLRVNSSLSLAATNIVELANTGYTIEFDSGVPEEKQAEMRERIELRSRKWGHGVAGLHGLINKLIYQVYIGGAVSSEWVLENELGGVQNLALVNPETVRVHYNRSKHIYEFYQVPTSYVSGVIPVNALVDLQNHVKLNPVTYSYYALMGDEDSPVGIPPFLSALDDIQAQLKMLKNIGYVSDQLGLMGFMEVLLQKPGQREGENITQYQARLSGLLGETKVSIKEGLKDGILTGYEGDHEFEFHSTTKDTSGVADIFDINQRMVANGLQSSNAFMNGSGGGAETMVNIVFTKMLSQLHNIQTTIARVMEEGITMDLLLGGYSFKKVTFKFKPSTISDELKTQQSNEIKVRNNRIMYADGIIGMTQYANAMGFDKADQKEPRVEIDPNKTSDDAAAKKKKEEDKDAGDRKSRDKKKAQPKRKDTDTRKR